MDSILHESTQILACLMLCVLQMSLIEVFDMLRAAEVAWGGCDSRTEPWPDLVLVKLWPMNHMTFGC